MKKLLTVLLFSTAIIIANAEEKNITSLGKGSKFDLYGRSVTLVDVVNPDLTGVSYSQRFNYEKWDNPKLKQLCETYKLKEVIAAGKTEFDQMVLLNHWVYKQFPKFGQPTKNTRNALEILEMAKNGATFFCIQYGSTFLSTAYSLGWVSRVIALHNLLGNPGSPEHTTSEIWSNQYRKWIMFDPTFDIYIEKDGIPLNCNEIRVEWFKNRGEELVYVKGIEKKKFKKSDLPIPFPGTGFSINEFYPDWYSILIFYGNGNHMDSGAVMGDNSFMISDEMNKSVKWHIRDIPKNTQDAYWSLGEAKMNIQPRDKNKLTVIFTTNTPNFDTYLIKINDGEWKDSTGEFTWSLKKGENKLSATTRNKMGIKGPENSIIIRR